MTRHTKRLIVIVLTLRFIFFHPLLLARILTFVIILPATESSLYGLRPGYQRFFSRAFSEGLAKGHHRTAQI